MSDENVHKYETESTDSYFQDTTHQSYEWWLLLLK